MGSLFSVKIVVKPRPWPKKLRLAALVQAGAEISCERSARAHFSAPQPMLPMRRPGFPQRV
jgi:hypothetical protein